jgi:hypothetical protein
MAAENCRNKLAECFSRKFSLTKWYSNQLFHKIGWSTRDKKIRIGCASFSGMLITAGQVKTIAVQLL